MSRTLVIAEPGCTAQGDYATMVRLLETAKACGADVWKPQWVSSAEAHLQRRTARIGEEEKAAFRAKYATAYSWLQWPVEWHADFRDRCHDLDMEYACSVCLPEDVATVAPFVDYLKISNFESDDPLLRKAWSRYRRVKRPTLIVSWSGNGRGRMWAGPSIDLHCVAAYPADLEDMNLRCITQQYDDYDFSVAGYDGLSDHSRHLITGALAVACGASAVEAHYRLDDCDPLNLDYVVAFAPAEFAQYIQYIRDAESMLGDIQKTAQPCEAEMLRYKVNG